MSKLPIGKITGVRKMWAVIPENGMMKDTLATFSDEGYAENWRSANERFVAGALVVVEVWAQLTLTVEGNPDA